MVAGGLEGEFGCMFVTPRSAAEPAQAVMTNPANSGTTRRGIALMGRHPGKTYSGEIPAFSEEPLASSSARVARVEA
jgi:hypothetical protein